MLPPPPPAWEFSFIAVAVAVVASVVIAYTVLMLQWLFFVPLLPARQRHDRRRRARRQAVQQAAAAKVAEAEHAEALEQVGPAPRVRIVAWIGTDLESATTAPRLPAPPLHANPRLPRNKVAPAPKHDGDLGHATLGERWTMGRVLCCAFTVSQTVLSAVLGGGITFGVFTLLLLATPYYGITDTKVLLALILLPVASAIFAPMFAPMALPEAAEKGWIGHVRVDDLPFCLRCLPFLRATHAISRHAILGVTIASIWIPAGLFALSQILAPPYHRSTVAIFATLYNASIAMVVMPCALLGFCVQPNFERVIGRMSMHEDKLQRLVQRVLRVPLS